ncbi:MAG: pyrroline-5-carboxylate reductase [Planctomycetota bacterium]
MSARKRIGFLGTGKMGTALASGFVRGGFCRPDDVVAYNRSPERARNFAVETGCDVVDSPDRVVEAAETLIVAVKPRAVTGLLDSIASLVDDTHLVVSVAAGCSLAKMRASLGGGRRIVRVMPNTPCLVAEGATVFATGPHATEADAERVTEMFATVGVVERVDETLIDAVTGLSGSGPAYVFEFVEALVDGAVRMGLPRETAHSLAVQTVVGAGRMLAETGEIPAELKNQVASPGGTTMAALFELDRCGSHAAVMTAVEAATKRSAELGLELSRHRSE